MLYNRKVGFFWFVLCLGMLIGFFAKPTPKQVVQNTDAIMVQTDYRIYFTPSKDCENNIIAEINKAKKIDIAVYSITNRAIVNAILAAHNRGANIRIITDRLQSKGNGSLVGELVRAGIPVKTNIKHKIEHNKFAVFDSKYVVSGSYNWTQSASYKNSENCIFFNEPKNEYSHRFEYLWKMYNKK